MPTVCLQLQVDNIENYEVHCSDANLAIDRNDIEKCTNVAVILGLPTAITKRELEIFVDPFTAGIEGLCLLKERKCLASLIQYKTMALVFFLDEKQLASFKDLYNNMQLPSYSETAPCVVVQLSSLVVHFCSPAVHHQWAFGSMSSSSSPNTKLTMANASPSKSFSAKGVAFQSGQLQQNDSLLHRGTQLLMQNCSSPTEDGISGKKASPAEPTGIVSQMVALPTCTVCLRRIRCVSTLACGLSGANDLMVGRSYTCDAKLSFDELSTMENQKTDVVVKEPGAESADEMEGGIPKGVRCIVCHIYHEVTASRTIGSSSNSSFSILNRLQSLRIDPTGAIPPAAAAAETTTNVAANAGNCTATAVTGSSNVTATCGSVLGRCRMCNLSENIWLCLQCGHTGCGRYTSQHAKAHYQHTLQESLQSTSSGCSDTASRSVVASHNLSLELASGRIWNYETDTFDYIEDESSHYFSTTGTQRSLIQSSLGTVPVGEHSNSEDAPMQTESEELPLDRASPTQCKKFLLPSFLYSGADSQSGRAHAGRVHGYGGLTQDLLEPSSAASLGLDEVTTDKINALMNNYERLLEAQLLDQQLYFEKLLARETVRALELSYMPPPVSEKGNVGSGKKNKAVAKKASFTESVTSAATEEKNDDSSPSITAEDAAYSTTSLLTESHAYREASNAVQNSEVALYMNEVEQLKLEISSIELQYREVLDSIKKADEIMRGLKKSNDALIKAQQALKDKEMKLKARSTELQAEHDAQVRDLQQQIQDLTFYAKTRKQVQESPLKDELKQGTVITTQRYPPTPTNSSTNTSGSGATGGNGGNEKKLAKRK